MSFNVQENEPIVLRLTLPEQDDSKFVRAIVKDESGIALSGSPFTLQNKGDGEYCLNDPINLLFPENKLELVAIYQVYDDAGFLIPTVDYGQQAMDVFRSLNVGSDMDETITRIEKLVDDTLKLRDDIDILIEEDEPIELEVQQD